MVHVGRADLRGVVGHLLGRGDSADATCVNLDEAEFSEIHQIVCHIRVLSYIFKITNQLI